MRNNYTIRLKRFGRNEIKIYYFIVSLKQHHVISCFKEKLGFLTLLPNSKKRFLAVNFERLGFWILKGATLSHAASMWLGRLHYSITKINMHSDGSNNLFFNYSRYNQFLSELVFNFSFLKCNPKNARLLKILKVESTPRGRKYAWWR